MKQVFFPTHVENIISIPIDRCDLGAHTRFFFVHKESKRIYMILSSADKPNTYYHLMNDIGRFGGDFESVESLIYEMRNHFEIYYSI